MNNPAKTRTNLRWLANAIHNEPDRVDKELIERYCRNAAITIRHLEERLDEAQMMSERP